MASQEPDTEELLTQARQGDSSAADRLLARHRDRLRQMVMLRMDPRLHKRFDPSDVVQESLATAHKRLPKYLSEQPLPFYVWLRQIAWNHLVDLHRRHVQAERRSVTREHPWDIALSDQSALKLADRLPATVSSPSRRLLRAELSQAAALLSEGTKNAQ